MSYNTIVSCVHHIMTYILFTCNVYIHVDIYLSGEASRFPVLPSEIFILWDARWDVAWKWVVFHQH